MRLMFASFALVVAGLLVATETNLAQDKKTEAGGKEVVLKGKVACNKCERGESKVCETVVVLKDEKSKKDIVYFFDKASNKKYHGDICSAAKDGSVTGVVKDDGKKKVISVSKIAYD